MGCHSVLPKRSLIRVVRRPEGVQIDPTGKLAGRGAYLHDRRACWEKSLRGSLAHALKADLTPEDLGRLRQFMQGLSDREEEAGEQA